MKTLGSFLVLVVLLLMTMPAYANDVTLFGGFQHQGKLTLTSGAASAGRVFDPTNFGAFGIRYGHGRVVGSEHTIAYTPNFIESGRKAIFYNSNLLVQAPLPAVRPYGTVGLGSIFTFGDSVIDIGNKFAVNYGVGLKVAPAGPVGVRF